MDNTHETLERVLKIHMDKLKHNLCLKFESKDYVTRLARLNVDADILNGDVVTITIREALFLEAITAAKRRAAFNNPIRTPEEIEFTGLLERVLLHIPRMKNTLAHPAKAHALEFYKHPETGKLKRRALNEDDYERKRHKHPYEREIHFGIDHRCTAIHWKSGTIVRDFGKDRESAIDNARTRILALLSDESIYQREESSFKIVEPHEDIIYDLVLQCKTLNQDEISTLIDKLKKEYLP